MLSALLVVAATCAASGANELVGLWESRDTSKGGIGGTVEFRADGVTVSGLTVLVNMVYRVDDDRLDVAMTKEELKGNGMPFKVDAETLTQTSNESTVVKKRFGGDRPDSRSIVGAWTYPHYTGGVAYERYTPDGRLEFRLALSANTDCYSVSNGRITFAGPKPGTNAYTVKGDELTIEKDRGRTLAYVRVKPGPWYPREVSRPAAGKQDPPKQDPGKQDPAPEGGRPKDER
jgi:hypothetical protein